METSGALTKVLPKQSGENARGLLYIGKKDNEMKRLQGVGENSSDLKTSCPLRLGILVGLCWQKSVPGAVPRGWRGRGHK